MIKSLLSFTAKFAWMLFCAWALTIFILSSMTGTALEEIAPSLLNYDKIVHAIAFAVGATLLAIALRLSRNLRGWTLFWFSVLGIALYGAFDELHQLFTPGRSGADFLDWVADMIGGSIAAAIYSFFYARSHGNHSSGGPGPDAPTPHGD